MRAVRTDEWKYVRYPHGDGGPDRHKADLFHLPSDPEEARNLIDRSLEILAAPSGYEIWLTVEGTQVAFSGSENARGTHRNVASATWSPGITPVVT